MPWRLALDSRENSPELPCLAGASVVLQVVRAQQGHHTHLFTHSDEETIVVHIGVGLPHAFLHSDCVF